MASEADDPESQILRAGGAVWRIAPPANRNAAEMDRVAREAVGPWAAWASMQTPDYSRHDAVLISDSGGSPVVLINVTRLATALAASQQDIDTDRLRQRMREWAELRRPQYYSGPGPDIDIVESPEDLSRLLAARSGPAPRIVVYGAHPAPNPEPAPAVRPRQVSLIGVQGPGRAATQWQLTLGQATPAWEVVRSGVRTAIEMAAESVRDRLRRTRAEAARAPGGRLRPARGRAGDRGRQDPGGVAR